MKIAVVILNWNGRNFLDQFLPFVIQFSHHVADMVVIDNASTDDSVALLKSKFPEVKIILNESNLGFAGGYNSGLKKINAEYLILLNSDVEVTPNWIEPVIALMEKNSSIAACQPKIKSFYNRNMFEYAGAAGGFIDRYGYPFCRGRIFGTMEEDKNQYNDSINIFWATGACMFIRSKTFQDEGGFDELFFAHMEEIDLCWRLQLAGHEIKYCADSTVYHIGGGTLPKINPRKTYLNFRNNLLMIYKNADRKMVFSILIIRTILDFIAAIRFLFGEGGVNECIAVFKAHLHFHQQKKSMKRTKENYSTENASLSEFNTLQKSILFGYYIKGKKKFSQLSFRK